MRKKTSFMAMAVLFGSITSSMAGTTPPVIGYINPKNGEVVSGIITPSAGAWVDGFNASPLKSVEFYLNGKFRYSSPTADGASSGGFGWYNLNTATLRDGKHTLTVKVTDRSGNVASKSSIFIAKNVAPMKFFYVSVYDKGQKAEFYVNVTPAAWLKVVIKDSSGRIVGHKTVTSGATSLSGPDGVVTHYSFDVPLSRQDSHYTFTLVAHDNGGKNISTSGSFENR